MILLSWFSDVIWKLNFRAYDRAAIKFRGNDADINFDLSDYEEDMAQVRRNSNFYRCFSSG